MKPTIPLLLITLLTLPLPLYSAEDDSGATGDNTSTEESSAAPEPVEAVKQTPQSLARQRQFDLAAAQDPETEIIWLDNGDNEQLALLQRSVKAEAHGGILIFPDRGSHADWPSLIHPLRTQLTEYGWDTLVIDLPLPPAPLIPERTLPTLQQRDQIQNQPETDTSSDEASESATDTVAETAADSPTESTATETAETEETPDYPTTIVALANQAMSELPGDSDIRVILGIGEGATWALHFAQQNSADQNQSVVLISPEQSTVRGAPQLNKLLQEPEPKILDLWFNSSPEQVAGAKLRKRITLRSGNGSYRQIRLNQRLNDPRRIPLWLTKQIRGLLKNHILSSARPTPAAPQATELSPGS